MSSRISVKVRDLEAAEEMTASGVFNLRNYRSVEINKICEGWRSLSRVVLRELPFIS